MASIALGAEVFRAVERDDDVFFDPLLRVEAVAIGGAPRGGITVSA
jgi:hypothetical protein